MTRESAIRATRRDLGLRVAALCGSGVVFTEENCVVFPVPEGEVYLRFQVVTDRAPLRGVFAGCVFRNERIARFQRLLCEKYMKPTKRHQWTWSSMFCGLSSLGLDEDDTFYFSDSGSEIDDLALKLANFMKAHLGTLQKFVTMEYLLEWAKNPSRDRRMFYVLDENWSQAAVMMVNDRIEEAGAILTQRLLDGTYPYEALSEERFPDVVALCEHLQIDWRTLTQSGASLH
jgi:hypothetical protein